MCLAGSYPLEQVAHQLRHPVWWRCHVQTVSVTIENAYTFLSIVTSVAHKFFHHQSMCLQQVFLFESIEFRHQVIGFNSIFHLLYFVGGSKHVFPFYNIRYLL